MFKQLKAKIRYLVDNAFARKFLGQFLLFMSLVVPFTLLGTLLLGFGLFGATPFLASFGLLRRTLQAWLASQASGMMGMVQVSIGIAVSLAMPYLVAELLTR